MPTRLSQDNNRATGGQPVYDPVLNQLYLGNPADSAAGLYDHGLIAPSITTHCVASLAWQRPIGLNASGFNNPVIPPVVASGVVYYADGDASQVLVSMHEAASNSRASPQTRNPAFSLHPQLSMVRFLPGGFDYRLYAFGL